MSSRTDYQNIIKLIEKENDFLITSHQDPDGDSIGSLIGLYKFLKGIGKRVIAYNEGRLPDKYEFLDTNGEIRFSNTPPEFKPRVAIVLECPDISRTGFVEDMIDDSMTVINIDHHPKNMRYGDMNCVDESASAVAEVLFDIIKSNGHDITPEIAESFYAAIASDTGRFKFTNTSSKCFLTASQLVAAGANPKEVSDKVFSSFNAGTLRLLGNLLVNLELHDNGRICILKLTLDDLAKYKVKVEDTEGIIDYSLIITGVKVGILFKERDSHTVKVGLRSQNGIDISVFARAHGGGGHANAAGFNLDINFHDAVARTIKEMAEFLND
jgi:phosphoesterase RecJ-like protein